MISLANSLRVFDFSTFLNFEKGSIDKSFSKQFYSSLSPTIVNIFQTQVPTLYQLKGSCIQYMNVSYPITVKMQKAYTKWMEKLFVLGKSTDYIEDGYYNPHWKGEYSFSHYQWRFEENEQKATDLSLEKVLANAEVVQHDATEENRPRAASISFDLINIFTNPFSFIEKLQQLSSEDFRYSEIRDYLVAYKPNSSKSITMKKVAYKNSAPIIIKTLRSFLTLANKLEIALIMGNSKLALKIIIANIASFPPPREDQERNAAQLAAEFGDLKILNYILSHPQPSIRGQLVEPAFDSLFRGIPSTLNLAHLVVIKGQTHVLDWLENNPDLVNQIFSQTSLRIFGDCQIGVIAAAFGQVAILEWIETHQNSHIRNLLFQPSQYGYNLVDVAKITGQSNVLQWVQNHPRKDVREMLAP